MANEIEDYRQAIAENVLKLRTKKGYTQVQLCMATGIPQTTLSKIERTGSPLTLQTAYRVAAALDATLHDIIPAQSRDIAADRAAELAAIS